MLELLTFLETKALHDSRHPIGCTEVAHQIVFEADIESRTARIALARAAPTQLSIDPARFVTLRADNVETATVWNTGSKLNIGSAPSHIRRNRDRARLTSALHHLGFVHMKLRVQNVVRNFPRLAPSADEAVRFPPH